jgi:hypothetical protein
MVACGCLLLASGELSAISVEGSRPPARSMWWGSNVDRKRGDWFAGQIVSKHWGKKRIDASKEKLFQVSYSVRNL